MSIWTILLGVFALWVFTCLSVAIPLRNAADRPWHLQLIQLAYLNDRDLKPKGNCAYFWLLFFAPIFGICFLCVFILKLLCLPGMFLCYDWLIMPIKGLCVKHPLSKIYWIEIFTTTAYLERSTEYTDIPAKRFTLALLALTAVIAWVWAGKETAYVCLVDHICRNGHEMLELATTFWIAFTIVGLVCVLYLFTGNLLGPKAIEAWNFLSGKLCHQIEYEYEKSESRDDS